MDERNDILLKDMKFYACVPYLNIWKGSDTFYMTLKGCISPFSYSCILRMMTRKLRFILCLICHTRRRDGGEIETKILSTDARERESKVESDVCKSCFGNLFCTNVYLRSCNENAGKDKFKELVN